MSSANTLTKPIHTPPPNYDTRAPSVQACAIIMLAVTTLVVIMRFWSRAIAANLEFWWDDWAMLVTLLFSHSFLATLIYWTTVGLGKHQWMIPLSQVTNNAVLGRVSVAFYSMAIGMIKISALLFYARLFKTKGRMVMALWIVGIATVIWTIFLVIYPWTFCKPLAKVINPLLKGVCESRPAWNIVSTVINFVLDFITLLLPMPVIWKLQMNMKRKVAYLAVFVLGYSSAFLSFVRFVIISRNPLILSGGTKGDPDKSWSFVPLLLLSMLEAPMAIFALCGPSVNFLVARVVKYKSLNSLFSSRVPISDNSAHYKGSNGSGGSSKNHIGNLRPSRDGSSSTKAFVSDDKERYAGSEVPMGSINMKNDVRVETYQPY